MAKTTYIFQVEDGFSIDGIGSTPKKAFNSAQKELYKLQKKYPQHYLTGKKLTGRYNKYDKDGFTETGNFPYSIKKR